MNHQGDVIQFEVIDQFLKIVNVLGKRVRIVLRLIRFSHPHMVGHHTAIGVFKPQDQIAIIKGPSRIAM